MLTLRRETFPPTEAFRRDWSALRAGTPGDSVFTDLEWIEAGIRHALPPECRPLPLRFVDGAGRTAAMALLQEAPLQSRLGTLRTLRTIEINSQRIPPLLAPDPASQAEGLVALWTELGGHYDLIDLFKLDPLAGRLVHLCDVLTTHGIPSRLAPFDVQPRLVLPASQAELSGLRNKVSRKKLRWGRNRLEEHLGPLKLVRLRDPDDVRRFGTDALEATLASLAARSWQGSAGDALQGATNRAFYADVIRSFSTRGLLDVCLLEAGGRPLAFDLNLVERGNVYMLVGCYDPEWHRFSPGSQLFAAWAADSLARGDRVLEFGGDHLDYKEHWATECVPSHHLRLFGRTFKGRLKAALRARS